MRSAMSVSAAVAFMLSFGGFLGGQDESQELLLTNSMPPSGVKSIQVDGTTLTAKLIEDKGGLKMNFGVKNGSDQDKKIKLVLRGYTDTSFMSRVPRPSSITKHMEKQIEIAVKAGGEAKQEVVLESTTVGGQSGPVSRSYTVNDHAVVGDLFYPRKERELKQVRANVEVFAQPQARSKK